MHAPRRTLGVALALATTLALAGCIVGTRTAHDRDPDPRARDSRALADVGDARPNAGAHSHG